MFSFFPSGQQPHSPQASVKRHFCRSYTGLLCLFLCLIMTGLFSPAVTATDNVETGQPTVSENFPEENGETIVESDPEPEIPYVTESPNPIVTTPPIRRDARTLNLLLPEADMDRITRQQAVRLNFNPFLVHSPTDRLIAQLLYRPLYDSNHEGKYGLAEVLQFSADGKSVEIVLKEKLTWQNGQPITCHDVFFTLAFLARYGQADTMPAFMASLSGMSEYRQALTKAEPATDPSADPIPNLKGFHYLDDRRLKLSFTQDARSCREELSALPLIPAHLWWQYQAHTNPEISDDDNTDLPHYVGNGPYRISSDAEDTVLLLKATRPTADSPFRKARIAQIKIHFTEASLMAQTLLDTPYDLAVLEELPMETEDLFKEAGYQVTTQPGKKVLALQINPQADPPIFDDPRVAQAFYWLSPTREEMRENCPLPLLPAEPLSTEQTAWSNAKAALTWEQRLDQALELLLESGYTTPATPAAAIDQQVTAGRTPQELPQLTIRYAADDELLFYYIYNLSTRLDQARIYPNFQVLTAEESQEADLAGQQGSDLILLTEPTRGQEGRSLPLFRQGLAWLRQAAVQVTSDQFSGFTGVEDWVLQR